MPLNFKLYCKSCEWIFQDDSPFGRFTHLFLVLLWNLACLSSNKTTIHFHHLSWVYDSLQIYFAHMENDQTSDYPQDARHYYANPYNPGIIPFLTLIFYLLVTHPTSDTYLFPGASQYNWHNKYFKNSLQKR